MNRSDARSKSRSLWCTAALGGVITALMACGPVAPAMAAATPPAACNAMIIDATAGHVLHADSTVTAAAAHLESKGADIRIRVFTAAPDGSLDAYEAAQVAACPSWSFQGGIKPNLLVFLISLDHQDAIFYGANYSRMQGQVDQIRADMGGDFRSGDFATGIAKGEQETYSTLYPSGTPAWLGLVIILSIVLVFGLVFARNRKNLHRGGGSYGSRRGGFTYINTGTNWGGGGGFSSGGTAGGTAGGSSGSW